MWVAILLLLTAAASGASPCPYGNELPGFKLCSRAPWRTLRPLESTSADVRRVLGSPTHQSDLAHDREPYLSDEEAAAPVLTFDGGPHWDILVYFVKSDPRAKQALSEAVHSRLLSVELVPKKRRSFARVTFPAFYRREHIVALDAEWDEYSDGSGLVYEVYTRRTPYGGQHPGDLNRIRYGPSDKAKVEHARR